jgi:fatty acid desaturase
MKRLLWGLAWIAVLVWSLFAWGAYGLLDFFGGVAARNADIVTGHPETVEWLSWALTALRGLGLGAIVVVWGLVSLLILAVPAVLGLFLGGSRREQHADWRGIDRQGAGPFPPGQGPVRRIEKR